MSLTPLLQRWFEMTRGDPVVIDRDDINHEANVNTWNFSPTEEEEPEITVAGVKAFVEAIIEERRARLQGQSMLFYCWHDFQARQLRFSLVSSAHGRLPFGCTVAPTGDLSSIVARVVNQDWLSPQYAVSVDDDDPVRDAPIVLPVFVLALDQA